MKVHVFKAKILGWENRFEGIYFDAGEYSKEEAEEQFQRNVGYTTKSNGETYEYIYYEYNGVKYYNFIYLGLYDFENMPNSNCI